MTTTPTTITLSMSGTKFTKLKTMLNNASADNAYFPMRALRDVKTTPLVKLELDPQNFENLKGAVAKFKTSEAAFYLDLIFDVGQPQFETIVKALREEAMKASAEAQTGLTGLKEVTKETLKAAKPKAKAKSTSRKVG